MSSVLNRPMRDSTAALSPAMARQRRGGPAPVRSRSGRPVYVGGTRRCERSRAVIGRVPLGRHRQVPPQGGHRLPLGDRGAGMTSGGLGGDVPPGDGAPGVRATAAATASALGDGPPRVACCAPRRHEPAGAGAPGPASTRTTPCHQDLHRPDRAEEGLGSAPLPERGGPGLPLRLDGATPLCDTGGHCGGLAIMVACQGPQCRRHTTCWRVVALPQDVGGCRQRTLPMMRPWATTR
jgi:hypothetical protein